MNLILDNYLKETVLLLTDIDGPLFISKRGNRIHDSNFRRRVFNPALKRAGLTEFRFHSFRATSSTWLFQQGVPIPAVMDSVGHESPKTTMDPHNTHRVTTGILVHDELRNFLALLAVLLMPTIWQR